MWLELSRQGMQTRWVWKTRWGDIRLEDQEGDDRIA